MMTAPDFAPLLHRVLPASLQNIWAAMVEGEATGGISGDWLMVG